MGPAPAGANKRTFYLPLTAVYGQWCRKIAGEQLNGDSGVGFPPYMFQCTWRKIPDVDDKFFLGASLEGYNWGADRDGVTDDQVGDWMTVLRRARFDLIWTYGDLQNDRDENGERWDLNWSPVRAAQRRTSNSQQSYGDIGQRFGNCAETYPFLNLLL